MKSLSSRRLGNCISLSYTSLMCIASFLAWIVLIIDPKPRKSKTKISYNIQVYIYKIVQNEQIMR